jgi:Zn-dependent M28 family amino/carboxypeptidase
MIEAESQPDSAPLPGVEVEFDVRVTHQAAVAANVMGLLEGSDPKLREERVWLTCHLDGTGMSGLRPNQYHPGADCGASGAAVMLAVAKALAEHPQRPRRPVVFAAFTGSERGRLGSEIVAGWPGLRVKALLHLDRLGRGGDARFLFAGSDATQNLAWTLISTLEAESLGMRLVPELLPAADHWSFARRGFPAALLCGHRHADVHTVNDVPEKLNTARLVRVGRAIARAVWALANS